MQDKPTLADLATMDQPKPTRCERSIPVNQSMINHALLHFPDPVVEAIKARVQLGIQRYGTTLHTNDGRNTSAEIWQEIIDGLYYAIKGTLESPALSEEIHQYRFVNQVLTALIKVLSYWEELSAGQYWVASITKVSPANTPPSDRRVVFMLDLSSPDTQLRNKWTAGYFDDGEWYRSDNGHKVIAGCWADISDLSGVTQ